MRRSNGLSTDARENKGATTHRRRRRRRGKQRIKVSLLRAGCLTSEYTAALDATVVINEAYTNHNVYCAAQVIPEGTSLANLHKIAIHLNIL